jgi:hypothetical protein
MLSALSLSVSNLVAHDTKSYQILGCVIAQSAPRVNVMDLQFRHAPAYLTTPPISLQDFMAEIAICFKMETPTKPFRKFLMMARYNKTPNAINSGGSYDPR